MIIGITNTYSVCEDCMLFLANGPDDLDEAAAKRVEAGVLRLQAQMPGGQLVNGDNSEAGYDERFSNHGCECCGTRGGGSRYGASLLGDGAELEAQVKFSNEIIDKIIADEKSEKQEFGEAVQRNA